MKKKNITNKEQKRHKLADDLRHPLVDGLHPYAPLATGFTVDFFFGQRKAAEKKLETLSLGGRHPSGCK